MRVIIPKLNLAEVSQMGVYIQRECDGYPIYRLEKVVSGGRWYWMLFLKIL